MAIWRENKISLRVHVKRNWMLPSADQSCWSNKPGQALPVTSLRDARPRRPGVWAQHGALCRSCTAGALLAMHFIVWPRRHCRSYTVRALCRSCSVCAVQYMPNTVWSCHQFPRHTHLCLCQAIVRCIKILDRLQL